MLNPELHISPMAERTPSSLLNASGDRKPAQLDYKTNSFGRNWPVLFDSTLVALIERQCFKMSTEYHLHVAQGLDVFLVVANSSVDYPLPTEGRHLPSPDP